VIFFTLKKFIEKVQEKSLRKNVKLIGFKTTSSGGKFMKLEFTTM
jgi:hypothetical protein